MPEALLTLAEWKAQSSGGIFARRSSDSVLTHIDGLLAMYHAKGLSAKSYDDRAERHYILCELFFALDNWLKEEKKKSDGTKRARKPGVEKLYKLVV
ncbi:MAG TPA: hypothetical protein VHF22_14250, partial [Planctomycetota bacterium]|nr:hypothetical protein [Planctomycetota bacterium]